VSGAERASIPAMSGAPSTVGAMEHRTTMVETCPGCGSLDVRAAEPRWFSVEFERRDDVAGDEHWVERVEFGCRDCGDHWD
jgi:predicted RNA-binding Zn-ribbon protein involved in translation (DUF1610 family)